MSKVIYTIFLSIAAIMIVMFAVGGIIAARSNVNEMDYILPKGYQNGTDLGNNWYTFELEKNKFLFNYSSGEMEKIDSR